jgi:hypothetical protein
MAENNPSTPADLQDFDVRLTELHNAARAYAQATEAYARAADALGRAAFDVYGDADALSAFKPPCVCICVRPTEPAPDGPDSRQDAPPAADQV